MSPQPQPPFPRAGVRWEAAWSWASRRCGGRGLSPQQGRVCCPVCAAPSVCQGAELWPHSLVLAFPGAPGRCRERGGEEGFRETWGAPQIAEEPPRAFPSLAAPGASPPPRPAQLPLSDWAVPRAPHLTHQISAGTVCRSVHQRILELSPVWALGREQKGTWGPWGWVTSHGRLGRPPRAPDPVCVAAGVGHRGRPAQDPL